MFSRQHYQKFAELLKKMSSRKDQEMLAIELLKLFKADNPRFDSAMFLRMGGVEESPRISKATFNEAFGGNVGLKLISLMPVGKIEGRGNVHEATPRPWDNKVNPSNPNEPILDILSDLEDAIADIENEADEEMRSTLNGTRKDSVEEGYNLAAITSQIQHLWSKFFVDAQKLIGDEQMKLIRAGKSGKRAVKK